MKICNYIYFIVTFIILILLVIQNNKPLIMIIIPADLYYFNTVRNFFITTIKFYNIKNFKVIATSLNMYNICKKYNVPVDISPKLLEENSSEYKIHTIGFAKRMRLKNPIFLKYLKTTTYLLALDADIFFFENPITLLKYINLSVDMLLVCDNSKCDLLNYGLMYIILYTSLDYLKRASLH